MPLTPNDFLHRIAFTVDEVKLVIAALSNMQESDAELGHDEIARNTRALIDRIQRETA